MQKEITVGFLTADSVDNEKTYALSDVDVAAFSVKELSLVKVKSELDGSSDAFLKMGRISERIKGLCAFSVLTDTFGVFRKTVACFYKGRLEFLADENTPDGRFSPAFGLKTLSVCGVKYGVLVGNDLLDTDRVKALALTETDMIINLSADFYGFDHEKLVSALAFLNGIPILSVSHSKKAIALSGGELAYCGKDGFLKKKIILKKRFKERTQKILF